jgi:hypothetical protein
MLDRALTRRAHALADRHGRAALMRALNRGRKTPAELRAAAEILHSIAGERPRASLPPSSPTPKRA